LNLPINRSFYVELRWLKWFYLAGGSRKAQGTGFPDPGVEATDLAKGSTKSVIFIQGIKSAAERLLNSINASLKDMQIIGVQAPRSST